MLITATDICTLIIAELLWVCYISPSFGFKGWNYALIAIFLLSIALMPLFLFCLMCIWLHVVSFCSLFFSFHLLRKDIMIYTPESC